MAESSPSLVDTFAALRLRARIGLLPFLPAGYPDLPATARLLEALERGGASAIEVGIPFSDPIADGPVIQEAFTHALGQKVHVHDVFETVRQVRPAMGVPLVAMVSYSIVFRYGAERFVADARAAGFNGLILPDLPPPDAGGVCATVRAAGLDTILLVSPTTSPQRRRQIVELCSGFVYYLAVTGITGERDRLPPDIEQNLRQLRQITDLPVCVGFGISRPGHLRQLAGLADGAIVGSALVRLIREHMGQPIDALCERVTGFCRELLG